MKVRVTDTCVGVGNCELHAPDVFEVGEDGRAHVLVDQVPPELEDAVRKAEQDCPTDSVVIEQE